MLALFTHTAPHIAIPRKSFLLYGAVWFPPIPRFCERTMFPHPALPCVAYFPPAALPAFIGTIRLSDSLRLICLPPSSVVRHTLRFKRDTGSPGLPYTLNVQHAMVLDPGEVNTSLPLTPVPILTSVFLTTSSLPTKHFGARSLQPFGLRPAVLLSYA